MTFRKAFGASAWLPVKCAVCNAEQRVPSASARVTLVRAVVGIALLLATLFAGMKRQAMWPAVVLAVIALAYLGVDAARDHSRGVLVPVSRATKRRARLAWLLFLVPAMAWIIWDELNR
jgi:heme exporter protein D